MLRPNLAERLMPRVLLRHHVRLRESPVIIAALATAGLGTVQSQEPLRLSLRVRQAATISPSIRCAGPHVSGRVAVELML